MSENPQLSVGIIMDGNRRWARTRGVPAALGHEEGMRRIHDVVLWAIEAQVSHLYLYAFSTENWKRATEEVGALLALIERAFQERIKDIEALGARIRVIGERERFSKALQKIFTDVETRSAENNNITVIFCLSYGGRREIVDAISRLPLGAPVTEESISAALYTKGMQDPDLIIRPGGEKRLSNFLIWQSVYAELFFTETLWPDFTKEEFSGILQEYKGRSRRQGA
jgi:undecaprenyl diphosphate synthase